MRPKPPATEIPPSQIRQVSLLADHLTDPLCLYFGESNLPTPDFIKQGAKQALDDNYVFYTPNAGYPELRQAVADLVGRLHGASYDPSSEVVITAGGMMGIALTMFATLSPGDHAVVITPLWPNMMAAVRLAGAVPIEVSLDFSSDGYVLDYDKVEGAIQAQTRLLCLASPNNPTGWTATPDDHRRLLELAEKYDLTILADEVYERLFYEDTVSPSLCRLSEARPRLVVINSFSKTYSMTGWRVGWTLAPRGLAAQISKLQEFVVSHAPAFAQRAGIVAIQQGEDHIAAEQQRLGRLRAFAMERLNAMEGIELAPPRGSFYVFPRIAGLADSFGFCEDLLRAHHVGLAPGSAFGRGGQGHVRLCYAVDESILRPALYGLATFLKEGHGCPEPNSSP